MGHTMQIAPNYVSVMGSVVRDLGYDPSVLGSKPASALNEDELREFRRRFNIPMLIANDVMGVFN